MTTLLREEVAPVLDLGLHNREREQSNLTTVKGKKSFFDQKLLGDYEIMWEKPG